MRMTLRRKLSLLARSLARAWPSQGQHVHPGVPGSRLAGHSKGGCNRCSSIVKKLSEQVQKLVEMEGDLEALQGRISAEEDLSKLKEQKDTEALKCAMDEVKFSILKGAGAFVGLTTAVGSIVANLSRITEWFSGGKGSA